MYVAGNSGREVKSCVSCTHDLRGGWALKKES